MKPTIILLFISLSGCITQRSNMLPDRTPLRTHEATHEQLLLQLKNAGMAPKLERRGHHGEKLYTVHLDERTRSCIFRDGEGCVEVIFHPAYSENNEPIEFNKVGSRLALDHVPVLAGQGPMTM